MQTSKTSIFLGLSMDNLWIIDGKPLFLSIFWAALEPFFCSSKLLISESLLFFAMKHGENGGFYEPPKSDGVMGSNY